MDKKTAINLLGGTPSKAAKALGYKTVHGIYVWPDDLPLAYQDRVNGAAMRLKATKAPRSQPKIRHD